MTTTRQAGRPGGIRAAVPLIIPGDTVNTNPDRDTLRQRIAEVLWPLNAERAADAVLAVLPDPVDRAAFVAEAEAKLTAGCPDHGPNGGWLMTCQCEAIGVLRDLADEAQGAAEYSRALTTPPSAEAAAYIRERLADKAQRELDDTDLTEADIDRMMAEGTPVQIVTAPPGTYAAAAIASCPGYEMNPNPCRCPCEGCKHHCAAHNPDAGEAQQPDDGEGDELVCVDECGFCDACGFEPFGTPAEGWREAARFLWRTARDSGDRQGVLHGARLIEAELRRLADESGPCVAGEQQNETPEAETPTTTKPAASPSVVDEVVAALQAKAQALSVEAEEEMRRDLEDQAQVWHEAADLARRTGRKAVRNAQPTAKPETDGEGAATRFNWSDIIPAPVDETAQERDRLIDRINRVRVALNDCKERGATGMQYEIAVREAIGDREPRRGPGPLCHESDPRTLRECALKANHGGDHEDGDLAWPRQEHQPAAPADCNTGPAAGVRQDGATS